MDLLLDKVPEGPLGLLIFALILALVTVYRNARSDLRAAARELAAEREAHQKTRETKDADGRAFLQMFSEAQADSMAQVKDLGAVLTAVKEQGARLEEEMRERRR